MTEMYLILFWGGVLWLGYVYIGYPLILGLLSLVRRARPISREDYLPTVSVLIAARNEAKDIGWKVRETLDWDYPPDRLQVLVASDASEDGTDEILRGIRDQRFVFVRMEQRGGKNRALNRLVQLATGELLFFTDANAHIDPGCLRRLVRHFADKRVGCVTGHSYSVQEKGSPAVAGGANVYWGYEAMVKYFENAIGSVLVCDGAIFSMRAALYQTVLPDLANDLELPLRVSEAGYWTLCDPVARVLERDTESPSQEFARRRRIAGQGVLAMWKLRPALTGLRGWQFISHKLLRWLTLIPMLLILVSTAALSARPVFALLLILQGAFYGCAFVVLLMALRGRGVCRIFSVPFYVLLGSVGALAGIADTCLGKRFDVWEIATLSRGDATALQKSGQRG